MNHAIALAQDALVHAQRQTDPSQRKMWLDIAEQWMERARQTIGQEQQIPTVRLTRAQRLQ
jgi:hypothetical protein